VRKIYLRIKSHTQNNRKMKAITAVAPNGSAVPVIQNGRVHRHRDGENAEIQMYISKLKDLVPFMPKNRKLSKLEVIQHVIDYICDLQSALESNPDVNNFNAAAVLAQAQNMDVVNQQPVSPRQPLGVRPSPIDNTILSPPNSQNSFAINTSSSDSNNHNTVDKSC
jgi:DNA-binding protein inhibitor ID